MPTRTVPWMVARAFSETSGKIWSRTSRRAGEDGAALAAFAGGRVSVRKEAGAGAGDSDTAGPGMRRGSAAGFFPAADFIESFAGAGLDDFGAEASSRGAA